MPESHPIRILAAECVAAHPKDLAQAEACKTRLATRLDLSLSHDVLALNETATFRAPRAERDALYSKPFVFNIECAALLCAYTRVLAARPPYALAHRDFKQAAGHAAPFNSRKAIEDMFATLARRFAGTDSALAAHPLGHADMICL